MHLSEGVLHTPVLLAGVALAGVGVAVGLRRLESERLPLTALFAAAFFVAGTIHVPVGIGSVHLILNGMAGLFLGWAVFPAFLIALLLQVLFFSFGGFVSFFLFATEAVGIAGFSAAVQSSSARSSIAVSKGLFISLSL